MNKKQFETLEAQLLKRGYKKYIQKWHHEDYILGKGFHKDDNPWEENRNAYQIILSIYDFSDKNWPALSEHDKQRVGLECHVDVSRMIDERCELCFAWNDNTKISDVETIAESFFKWVESVCPTPPFIHPIRPTHPK